MVMLEKHQFHNNSVYIASVGSESDRALTQADVDACAASYAFGERTARRRTNDQVEAEALEMARRLVRKKGQASKGTTEGAREFLRAQAAKRVAELKDLLVA
jgi:hypothetical protein